MSNRKNRTLGLILRGSGLAAAALGGLYLYSRRQTRQAESRYPPEGDFIEAGGVKLHYLQRGSGRPVVFLHGNEGQLQDFTMSVFGRAAREFRVIAFDRPGHGYSERSRDREWSPEEQARVIHEALSRLGVERPILVAHSWSGSLAFAYALEFPDHVGGIVLLGGEVYEYDMPIHSRLALIPVIGTLLIHTLCAPIGRSFVRAGLEEAFSPDPVPPDYADLFAALSLRPGQFRAAAEDHLYANRFYSKMGSRYGEIRVPVAILIGSGDSIVEPERALRLHATIPDARLFVLPDSGHELAFTHPEMVMKAIRLVSDSAGSGEDFPRPEVAQSGSAAASG